MPIRLLLTADGYGLHAATPPGHRSAASAARLLSWVQVDGK
jgi:hypothetical protein